MYQTTIYRGAEGLAAIATDWAFLLSRVQQPLFFHLHEWWCCYLEALVETPDDFFVLAVRDVAGIVAILPLQRHRSKFAARAVGLPHHYHLPLGDILCDPSVADAELFAAVRRSLAENGGWDVLDFRWVLATSSARRLISHESRRTEALLHTCDYLDCERSYDEIVAGLSRNFRTNLNNARNRLKREGTAEFAALDNLEDLRRLFPKFLEIEASGWKSRAGTAIKLDPRLTEFYRTLIEKLAPRGDIVFNTMAINGAMVAMQFCIKDANSLYVLKLGYDEQWSRVAPGNLLIDWVIRRAAEQKLFRYLNVLNDPPWFKNWRPASVNVCNAYLYNRTPRGMMSLWAAMAKRRMKSVYEYVRRRANNNSD